MIKKAALIVFAFWAVLGVMAEFWANDDPILYSYEGKWVCASCLEWGSRYEHEVPDNANVLIPALVPYDASTLEPAGYILQGPLSEGTRGLHVLGTDSQSRDILAGIIYGARYALLIALLSTLLAGICGTLLGIVAGYYGNRRFRLPLYVVVLWLLGIAYSIYLYVHALIAPFTLVCILIPVLFWPFWLKKRKNGMAFPLDSIITKGIEVIDSLPALFILLAWAATIQEWTIFTLSLLIAFFRWPTFARLSRIEVNKWLSGDWINSLKALKMSDRWIITRQLSDLIIIPLSVHAAFVAAGAISIEATLSFLGFGLGAEVVSWGGLLNEARQYFHAWWLIIFPGISLFSLLWAFNQWAKFAQQYVRRSRLAPPENTL